MTTSHALQIELGTRLARIRLDRNITQSALSREAGVGLRTVRRIEAGGPITLDSFLRIAVALDLGDCILDAVPYQSIRPIDRLGSRKTRRKRARPRISDESSESWSWGD